MTLMTKLDILAQPHPGLWAASPHHERRTMTQSSHLTV
jgi:hypothetical protein